MSFFPPDADSGWKQDLWLNILDDNKKINDTEEMEAFYELYWAYHAIFNIGVGMSPDPDITNRGDFFHRNPANLIKLITVKVLSGLRDPTNVSVNTGIIMDIITPGHPDYTALDNKNVSVIQPLTESVLYAKTGFGAASGSGPMDMVTEHWPTKKTLQVLYKSLKYMTTIRRTNLNYTNTNAEKQKGEFLAAVSWSDAQSLYEAELNDDKEPWEDDRLTWVRLSGYSNGVHWQKYSIRTFTSKLWGSVEYPIDAYYYAAGATTLGGNYVPIGVWTAKDILHTARASSLNTTSEVTLSLEGANDVSDLDILDNYTYPDPNGSTGNWTVDLNSYKIQIYKDHIYEVL